MNKELIDEFWRLSKMSDIPNMEAYAQAWYILARKFEKVLFPAMAANCHGHWKQYMPKTRAANGHYVRTINQPFSELAQVPS